MTLQCKKCGSQAFNLHWDGIEQRDLCDRHYWQDRAENPQMQWTKERPTQAGVYWALTPSQMGIYSVKLSISKTGIYAEKYGAYRKHIEDRAWNDYQWLGPIEVPAPPIATPQT